MQQVTILYLALSLQLEEVAAVKQMQELEPTAALAGVEVIIPALAARAPPDHPYKDIMAALVLLLLDHIWEVEVEALVQ